MAVPMLAVFVQCVPIPFYRLAERLDCITASRNARDDKNDVFLQIESWSAERPEIHYKKILSCINWF